jgi:D-alanyl-D-alanine carboxypeptidase (penicillin-binding protein 5/6)
MSIRPDGAAPAVTPEAEDEVPGVPFPDDDTAMVISVDPNATRPFSGLSGVPSMNNPNAINAPFGALYNLTDDVFVYGKNVDERIYPSGTVKLLTALTVYDALFEIPGAHDFIFEVGDEIELIRQGSGVAGLFPGQRLNLEAILTALLIPVGNDAAYTISVNTARALTDPENERGDNELNDYFLRLMNDYAQKIGCQNSNFSNPDGFHASNNFSTIRDLMFISAASAENPLISLISGKREHEVVYETGERISWVSSNRFLSLPDWDIRGLRTGFTEESRFSAQILAEIDGKLYLAAVSGCASADTREADIIRLLEMASHGHDADVISVIEG